MRLQRMKKEPAYKAMIDGSPAPARAAGTGSPAKGRARAPKTPTKPNGQDNPETLGLGGASDNDDDEDEEKDTKPKTPVLKKVQKSRVTKNTTPVKKSKVSKKVSMAAAAASVLSDADDSDLPVTPSANGVKVENEDKSIFGGLRTGSGNGSYVVGGGEDDDDATAQLTYGTADGDSGDGVDAEMGDESYQETPQHWDQEMKDEV